MWLAPRRTTGGGQPRCSDLAIETALTLGVVFGLRLRQVVEGLLGSVLPLIRLGARCPRSYHPEPSGARTWQSPNKAHDLQGRPDGPVHILVDSTGLQVYGAGQWLEEKHGARSRRRWRKLHVALDADSSEILAHTMTDQDAGDASQVEPLLNQIDGRIGQFTADGAYDGKPTYDAVTDHSAATVIVIPPRANAIEPAGGCMRRRSVRRRSRPPPWPRPFDDLPRATTESPLSLIGTATDTFGVGKRRIGFPNTPCWSAVTKAEGKLLF